MPEGKTPEPVKAPNQTPVSSPKPAAEIREGNSGQSGDPMEGLRDAVQAQHTARTVVPGHPGVDARLDNRAGAFRPPLEQWPAKPQQVDGPDLAGQVEHTRKTLNELEGKVGPTKGQYSPGPHGLSSEDLRETDTAYGPEGLSVSEASKVEAKG